MGLVKESCLINGYLAEVKLFASVGLAGFKDTTLLVVIIGLG